MITPPRKTLIFHIGDHKTGSTSIQYAFAKRQVELQGYSVFYPARIASNALRDQCLEYGAAETAEARQKAAQPLKQLAGQVRDSGADFTVISAEALERVPAALLRKIIDTFFADSARDIRVIAYVRPHAGRIISTFAERTKVGVPHTLKSTLEDFAENRKKDSEIIYLPRFSAWRKYFGDRFMLRPMIRKHLHGGDVVHDFVHHAFGGIPFELAGTGQANESLCLEDLMRLKVLQSQLKAPRLLRLMVGWEMYRLIGHLPPPPARTKLQLHRSLAEDIRDTYMQDARNMDRAFFGGDPLLENDLDNAVAKALGEPQSTDPADHLSVSELRSLEIMSQMISGLLEQKDVDWAAFLHAKRVRDVQKGRKAAK
ncbi:hypothetical protein AB9K34_21645 [Sedimentitalea sp. XS_ASV28]|uniref:hypothetical protein n=1 Tax=Sedimentitalea sp. XS_ASV28 TaxID=3241296 RepID=UPI0035123CA6